MYLLSSVGQRVSHSQNILPNPVGPPDAIKGVPGTSARGSGPGRPLFSSVLGAPLLPAPRNQEGSWFTVTALVFDPLFCVSCPFSLAGL